MIELQIHFPKFVSCLLTLLLAVFYHLKNFYVQVDKCIYLSIFFLTASEFGVILERHSLLLKTFSSVFFFMVLVFIL